MEKFKTWSDCGDDLESSFAEDELLDNVMVYWLNSAATSSARLYWHSLASSLASFDEVPAPAVQVPGQSTWRRSMLADLRPDIQHLPGVVALLDLAAERAPQQVTYGEVLARSGLSEQEQRSNHQRLSWVTKRLFGTKTWPVEWQQAANGETRYRMPVEVARWWREG